MRKASWKQMIDVAHAADCVMTGPVRPYSIESWHAAIELDSAGKENGLTEPGPLVLQDLAADDHLLDATPARVDGNRHPIALLGAPLA